MIEEVLNKAKDPTTTIEGRVHRPLKRHASNLSDDTRTNSITLNFHTTLILPIMILLWQAIVTF